MTNGPILVNTESAYEASFVESSQFEQLLASPSSESREGLPQGRLWRFRLATRSRIYQPLKPMPDDSLCRR